eukprot:TRINITY_DN22570_c0_g1_i1.p1 TRINITY_DN22570_c0_g1~~TRINITY_DN22570_c0_g1_i1.p1  ORF type:complete len:357 (+),score=63.62 TRINITY_DN22570_c0_g1_i1:575-1645(+)
MIRKNWRLATEVGHPAALRSSVSRVVTVVDSSSFGVDWLDGQHADKRNEASSDSTFRPVVELLAEQIESADVILLSKVDVASSDEIGSAAGIAASVNPGAALLKASFGKTDLERLLPSSASTNKISGHDHSSKGHGHGHGHGHSHDCSSGHAHGHGHGHGADGGSPQERYGIYSFIFQQRRPFDRYRFEALVRELESSAEVQLVGSSTDNSSELSRKTLHTEALNGLLRAKGVCWIASEPLYEHFWSFAGRKARLAKKDPWWSACTEEHMHFRAAFPGMQDVYNRVRSQSWDESEKWGDRRQEIVFIGGKKMDEQLLRKKLEECLLSEDEMSEFTRATAGLTAPFTFDLGPGMGFT